MIVYLVTYCYDFVDSVFSTREKADSYISKQESPDVYDIAELEVDQDGLRQ